MIDVDELERLTKREGLIKLTSAQVRELVEELRLLRKLAEAIEQDRAAFPRPSATLPGGVVLSERSRTDVALDAWKAGR